MVLQLHVLLVYFIHFLAENHLRITSNISGNLRENDVIEYACDVRYAGNLIPSLIWTAKSQPRIIQNTRHNRPGLAKSVIQVIANKKSYGERYVCTMLFEVPHCNESNVATNVPDCILLKESNPLTVHSKYLAFMYKTKF